MDSANLTNEYHDYSDESDGSVFDVEDEELDVEDQSNDSQHDYSDDEDAYRDEPLADSEWLDEYNLEKQRGENRLKELQNRLDGFEAVSKWCTCGNCKVDRLDNAKECHCCHEIDGCMEALENELVLREVETLPNCVTLHPGFNAVCLNKWSLRSSAMKYRTIEGIRYHQTGTEDKFLRATAYREFTQLIHGYLGATKRYPLTACAYNTIREMFGGEDNETVDFTGFEDEDE